MAKQKNKEKKIFVLDTSVMIFDPHCFFNFQENDLVIPIATLEELDNMKKGTEDRNAAARQAIRNIEEISNGKSMKTWIPLKKSKGRIRVFTDIDTEDAIKMFESGKNDHRILNTALRMMRDLSNQAPVVLVSKDINLRIKAKALDINAEDYKSGMVKETREEYTGKAELKVTDMQIMDELFAKGFVSAETLQIKKIPNLYYTITCEKSSALARYDKRTDRLVRINKQSAYGISPRNSEQTFALDAVLNHDIRLITLEGQAGTGKTLIALAGALCVKREYHQIYLTRPIVPVGGKDLGFLPGDLASKTDPYMNGFHDNIKFIKSQQKTKSSDKTKKVDDLFDNEKIVIEIINYIRGRSLYNVLFIVDEAQNLTKHEIKTLITRAGEGTKFVLIGDSGQIDTPYLDRRSNGLAHAIEKFKGYEFYAHVTLEKGERSELATVAGNIL